jgi:predicted metal-dependent hydrolase
VQTFGARTRIDGRDIEYRVRTSKSAQRLRIRVGVDGIEVVQPVSREIGEVEAFLQANACWLAAQLDRMERIRPVRRVQRTPVGEILLRGEPTRIWREEVPGRRGGNRVDERPGAIVVITGNDSRSVPVAASLERWLRKSARSAIEQHAEVVAQKLGVGIGRIYIMDQRTKWASCSRLRNLSFSWRIIMAPDSVLRYLVAHEVVHLAIPDHSKRFWLTVQSICADTWRGRQWLATNGARLMVDLNDVFMPE